VIQGEEVHRAKANQANERGCSALFLNGLIGSTALDKMNSYLKAAEKKV